VNTVWLQELLPQLSVHPHNQNGYTLTNGVIHYKGRIVIGNDEQLKARIMQAMHDSTVGGHSGVQATYHRIRGFFYWLGLKREVVKYVLQCEVC